MAQIYTERVQRLVRLPPVSGCLFVPRRQYILLRIGLFQHREIRAEFGHVLIEAVTHRNIPSAPTETRHSLIDQWNQRPGTQLAVFALDHGRIKVPEIDDAVGFDVDVVVQRRKNIPWNGSMPLCPVTPRTTYFPGGKLIRTR
jgi:hypothetical protein